MIHTRNTTTPVQTFAASWALDAAKRLLVAVVVFTGGFFLANRAICRQPETTLAILDAGVERSEDAPFASQEYRFFPGDYLYFRFQIGGYAIHSDEAKAVRSISLTYDVTPLDEKGLPLAPAETGAIEAELNSEDKNWTPKRRVSFLLPSFVAAGAFHVRVTVKDAVGKSETARDFPFSMGGVAVAPSPSIAVENFHFFRNESDRDGLEVAAYRPGDTVFARFDMAGYQLAAGNQYHLTYGVTVLRPDGKPFVQDPNAAELAANSFYPAQFVPGDINVISTRASPKGAYLVLLTVKDLTANRTEMCIRDSSRPAHAHQPVHRV